MSPVTAPIAKPLAWIEGTVLSPDVARVPLEDRGVLFGESAYEAVLTRSGRVFALEPHLRRLERSATGAGICPAAFRDRIRGAVDALLQAGGEGDGLLYLHVTGGAAPREHVPAVAAVPGVYATLRPFDRAALMRTQEVGIDIATCDDERWRQAHWKTTQLLPNILAKRGAAAIGAQEAVFVDAEGVLLEGGSSNVWVVTGGVALTPPLTRNILPGVTRALLLEQASDGAREADVPKRMLDEADEVFITSTTRPVLAVVRADGKTVGDGAPGPVTRALAQRFRDLMDADLSA